MNISNIGGTIEHWLSFQEKIGRSFMINEDALKYPLADYLVNATSDDISAIELEKQHPNFSTRHVDLTISDKTNNTIKNVFEFKLAKSDTRKASEKQRIFNDLIRLHLAKQVSSDKCFFIIAGKANNFKQDFQNYPNTGNSRFYQKWFSFKKGKNTSFSVAGETDSDYKTIYDKFISDYSSNYSSQIGNTLQLPLQITTTCEFVTVFKATLIPYMAGIWSIS
jgi:hypothetical protein